jgi:uncharacterized damage-inducible protein DinB
MIDVAAPSARPPVFGDLEHELANTRRVLERVPDEHWGWKPHAKSGSLGELAAHLAQLTFFAGLMLSGDEFDVANAGPRPTPANREELLAIFDRGAAALREAVDALPAEKWGETWSLKAGGNTFLSAPRAGALRGMGISHIVHHRGQLTVYLRLLDVPVPGLYGPSADERGG